MQSDGESGNSARAEATKTWRLAQAALAFAVDQMCDGLTGVKTLDALLVMAINQANIAPLTRDIEARSAYGALAAPAPDESRRPVSIHAIAASLHLPFETVRRHVGHLETLGFCRHEGRGVIIPAAYLSSPAYLQDMVLAHARLVRLYQDISDAGLLDPLPTSAFPAADETPIRGAVRLVSDFLLRAAEILTRQTQDMTAGFILAAVASASLQRPPALTPSGFPAPGPGLTISQVARQLDLPAETARRRMGQLVAQGHCVRDKTGRHIAELRPGDPRWEPLIAELAANLQRLMAGLAERGVIDSWIAPSAEARRRAGGQAE